MDVTENYEQNKRATKEDSSLLGCYVYLDLQTIPDVSKDRIALESSVRVDTS
jgi:hypothetical protein